MLPLIRPDVTFDEVAADFRSILESGRLTSGPYVERFEGAIAELVGVEHGVATTSATTALHLALVALGAGGGDEVLVSDFTFPATANVVVQAGAVPVLVDCQPDTFSLDVDDARAKVTDRTAGILAVDPFGQPASLSALRRLADERGLFILEDAACALGSAVDGLACGAWRDAGCFSFHPRKVLTTGEGGMVTTGDGALASAMRRLRNHGGERGPVGVRFVEHGFNYRLSELQAAMGLAQLARLPAILAERRRIADLYGDALTMDGVRVPSEPQSATWSYQSYVVMLDDGIDRDGVIAAMAKRDIETTLGTYAQHAQPAFAHLGHEPGSLKWSFAAQEQSLTLPVCAGMDGVAVDAVVTALEQAIQDNRR